MARVLVVEDDEALRTVYGIITEAAGHTVKLAENGAIGLTELAAFKPNVVLLDMLMPIKSGIELLQEADIKTNYPTTSVIVMSNLNDTETINKALKLGAVKYLVKSNTLPEDIVKTITQYSS